MKNRIAHVVLHVFAIAIGMADKGVARVEAFVWRSYKAAQNSAYTFGAAAEQAIVNRAQQDLADARRRLEQANTEAKAVLRALPEKMNALAKKVYE